jgi:hypothetical protein
VSDKGQQRRIAVVSGESALAPIADISLRRTFRAEDGSIRPGRGLALSVRHLERLTATVEKARRGAVARDLIPPSWAEDRE